jgi:hypothetical protein
VSDIMGHADAQRNAAIACKCSAEVCGHMNDEPCGKPVKDPVGYVRDEHGRERPVGLCEECWKKVRPHAGK